MLCAMSAATIDRRMAGARAKLQIRGRSHTKPGSLLKDAIAIRTRAQWDDAAPGFVEINLVSHESRSPRRSHSPSSGSAQMTVQRSSTGIC